MRYLPPCLRGNRTPESRLDYGLRRLRLRRAPDLLAHLLPTHTSCTARQFGSPFGRDILPPFTPPILPRSDISSRHKEWRSSARRIHAKRSSSRRGEIIEG